MYIRDDFQEEWLDYGEVLCDIGIKDNIQLFVEDQAETSPMHSRFKGKYRLGKRGKIRNFKTLVDVDISVEVTSID